MQGALKNNEHMHSQAPSQVKTRGSMPNDKGHSTWKFVKNGGHMPPVPPSSYILSSIATNSMILHKQNSLTEYGKEHKITCYKKVVNKKKLLQTEMEEKLNIKEK